MKNLLILSLALVLGLSACRPKPTVQPEDTPKAAAKQAQHDTTQKIPEYTREEMIQKMEADMAVQSGQEAEVPTQCTPEAQKARAQRLQELHQAMMKLTQPQERHALSKEYSNLQAEEAGCFQPHGQQ